MTEKLLLTPIETAELLGIGRTKIYEFIRSEKGFPTLRIGNQWRIPKNFLLKWIEDNSGCSV